MTPLAMVSHVEQQAHCDVQQGGAAATAFPLATDAALEILRAGGNAVDAAVAAAWALSVCEPGASGLGGQTMLLLHTSAGTTRIIDGHSHAPAAASCDTISETQQRLGHRACVIPSTVATLGYAQQEYGFLPREQVMAPAIQIAEEGYPITPLQHRQLGWVSKHLGACSATANLFLAEGALPLIGDIFRQPELAATLYRLAQEGTEDFYHGEIAELIAKDMKAHGGLITSEDLTDLGLPVEREPLFIDYRGLRVVSVPPPSGGLQLLLALKILEQLGDNYAARQDDWYEDIAATIYAVFAERERSPMAADRSEGSICEELLSGKLARQIAEDVRNHNWCEPLLHGGDGPGDTTHLTVADRHGNVVALTQSIQSVFGAKVAHPTLGFVYSNYLRTCPRLPHPSRLGSRCVPRSNAAPTLVLRNVGDGFVPVLALGAAGSRRIMSSILQVVSSVIDRGLDIAQAVAAPRVHALLSRKAWIEKPAASDSLLARLRQSFSEVRVKPTHDYALGSVQALQWLPSGELRGAADPRRDGVAAVER